jgi:hypothetical protein
LYFHVVIDTGADFEPLVSKQYQNRDGSGLRLPLSIFDFRLAGNDRIITNRQLAIEGPVANAPGSALSGNASLD